VQKLVFLANHLKLVQKTGLSNQSFNWCKKVVFLTNHLTGAKKLVFLANHLKLVQNKLVFLTN